MGLPIIVFLELWNYTTDPWTNLFKYLLGPEYGGFFYLVPLTVLTIGLYIKTNNVTVPSMFMIGSGAILGITTLTMGMPIMGFLFLIFATIGIATLFVNLIYGG